LQRPLVPAKRIAIVLHWLAQANSFSELAALYAIDKSTVATIVHEGVAILQERLVPEVILFPTGQELGRVMVDLEACVGCHAVVEPWMAHSWPWKSLQPDTHKEGSGAGIWSNEGAVEINGWKVLADRPSVRQTSGSGVLCPAQHLRKTIWARLASWWNCLQH